MTHPPGRTALPAAAPAPRCGGLSPGDPELAHLEPEFSRAHAAPPPARGSAWEGGARAPPPPPRPAPARPCCCASGAPWAPRGGCDSNGPPIPAGPGGAGVWGQRPHHPCRGPPRSREASQPLRRLRGKCGTPRLPAGAQPHLAPRPGWLMAPVPGADLGQPGPPPAFPDRQPRPSTTQRGIASWRGPPRTPPPPTPPPGPGTGHFAVFSAWVRVYLRRRWSGSRWR